MRTHNIQTGAEPFTDPQQSDVHYAPSLWINGNEVWRSRHLFDDEETAATYAEDRLLSTFERLMRD